MTAETDREVIHWTGFDGASFDDATNKANAALIIAAVNSYNPSPDSKLEAYKKALEEISRQKTTEELEAEEEEYGEASGGDIDGAFDALIGIARKALAAGG